MSGSSTMMLIAGAISWSLTMLVLLVFIIVVAVIVRKRRPDAALILLLGLGLEFLLLLGSVATTVALPRLIGGDMTSYAQAQSLNTILLALGHAVARSLLIWGVVRLASEPATLK